jgi:hypothetical protein
MPLRAAQARALDTVWPLVGEAGKGAARGAAHKGLVFFLPRTGAR